MAYIPLCLWNIKRQIVYFHSSTTKKIKVKCSRYRPGVVQRVGRGIALLFHDRGTSSTPRPHFTPGKDPLPILQETGWAPGSVWTRGKSRPHRDCISDRAVHSQSLYRLSYPPHVQTHLPLFYVQFWSLTTTIGPSVQYVKVR